jgi:hypothetical protein
VELQGFLIEFIVSVGNEVFEVRISKPQVCKMWRRKNLQRALARLSRRKTVKHIPTY